MAIKFEEKDFSEEGFNFPMWKKLLSLFKPYKKYIIYLAIIHIFIALNDILLPWMTKKGIDLFISEKGNDNLLVPFVVIYVVIVIITTLLHMGFFVNAGKCEMKFGYFLREKLMTRLQELSFSYYDKTPTGWLLSRVTSDTARLAEIIAWSFTEIFYGIPLIIISAIFMFAYNIPLTLCVLIALPIIGIITFYYQKRILKNYRDVRKLNSIITNDFSESINGIKTTKTLNFEESNYDEFRKDTLNFNNSAVKAAKLSGTYRPLVYLVSSLTVSVILWIGGRSVMESLISFGTLYMFVNLTQQFFEPIKTLAMIFQDFQMAQASGERIIYLLECEPSIKDTKEVIRKYGTEFKPIKKNFEPIIGNVEFRNVNFHYVENDEILNNFNLKVNAGETIALVGETGSGKSTIVNLLCRFYEPTSGEILIDGVDYRNKSIGYLHSNLGYVLQAPHLFSGTIKDNIKLGNLDASDEDVVRASKLVNAHEFITSLKDGYDTDVGENGSRLSTGQKQLISFARAIIAKPSIFVLDEATSSIDTETEKIIQFAIDNIMKEKTSFVIAHRLSTIVNADRILVIDKGKIIEQGTHTNLMKLKGKYYSLYTNQYEESLINGVVE